MNSFYVAFISFYAVSNSNRKRTPSDQLKAFNETVVNKHSKHSNRILVKGWRGILLPTRARCRVETKGSSNIFGLKIFNQMLYLRDFRKL